MTERHETPPELDPKQTPMQSIDVLRDSLGLSVAELARRIGRDRSDLGRMIEGERAPEVEVMARCMIALGRAAA